MTGIFALLIWLIVLAVIWWVGKYAFTSLGLPGPVMVIWNVLIVIFALILLLNLTGVYTIHWR